LRTITLSTGVGGGEGRSEEDAAKQRELLEFAGNNGLTEKPSTPFEKRYVAMAISGAFIVCFAK